MGWNLLTAHSLISSDFRPEFFAAVSISFLTEEKLSIICCAVILISPLENHYFDSIADEVIWDNSRSFSRGISSARSEGCIPAFKNNSLLSIPAGIKDFMLFDTVFRLLENKACMSVTKNCGLSHWGGSVFFSSCTTVEETFGRGQKLPGARVKRFFTVYIHWQSTLNDE